MGRNQILSMLVCVQIVVFVFSVVNYLVCSKYWLHIQFIF